MLLEYCIGLPSSFLGGLKMNNSKCVCVCVCVCVQRGSVHMESVSQSAGEVVL